MSIQWQPVCCKANRPLVIPRQEGFREADKPQQLIVDVRNPLRRSED